jgi:hypothetical protein
METDLQLLAKVDEYQQDKFDQGAQSLQNEINNWSMVRNQAKDSDREYANNKLSKLVSGIQNLGGVNLSDANNVNALKSLGYNIYGDENIMRPLLTTQKRNALMQDIYSKTNGKNAKDYDSVYGEYLTHQYDSWLNDGQQGTGFDGPTSLPQGSFDNYNKKVSDAISKLKPDMNEAPQNAADALNYYQVGDKFIKRDRVEATIDAITTGQDREIMSAHAWKGMGGISDVNLVGLQKTSYDSKIKSLQDTYNDLVYNKSHTNDYTQKELFTAQINQVKSAIDGISKQKDGLPQLQQGQQLDPSTQKALRDNLFNEAYKDQWATAAAYDQKKVELKFNQGKAFEQKMRQTAWMFGKNYDIKLDELKIKKDELALKKEEAMVKLYGIMSKNNGVAGPAGNAPLSLIPNNGQKDAVVLNNDINKAADANYIASSNAFYTRGYNYLMGKDPELYGKYMVKDSDDHWVPKPGPSNDPDKYKNIVNKGLQSTLDMYGNIGNMSIKERDGLNLNDDTIDLLKSSSDLNDATIYKNQMKSLTDETFRKAGLEPPSQKNITVNFKDGTTATVTFDKFKEMENRNDPMLKTWKEQAKGIKLEKVVKDEIAAATDRINKASGDIGIFDNAARQKRGAETSKAISDIYKKYGIGSLTDARSKDGFFGLGEANSFDIATDAVNKYYDNSDVKTQWDKASKDFNVYGASINIPTDKTGKILATFKPLQNYLGDQVRSQDKAVAGAVQNDDINIVQVWPTYNPSKGETKYMAKVIFQKGSGSDKPDKETKGDRTSIIDVTDEVVREHDSGGGWLSNQYADDNAQVVYGMLLNTTGKTPLDKNDGYSSAMQTQSAPLLTHKYQVVAIKNSKDGIAGYRVNILVPKGKDDKGVPQFQTWPVINFDETTPQSKTITNTFPSNLKYVQNYMDSWFQSTDRAQEFYRRHGIPFAQQNQQTNQ